MTLRGMLAKVRKAYTGKELEPVNVWVDRTFGDAFSYAAASEYCMERQLEAFGKGERKTTFMSDLSLGEWFGLNGMLDTFKNAVSSWKDDEEYMAEFILCVNWKAWEHAARKNHTWGQIYSGLYYAIKDLMFRYYEGDEKKTNYLWSYLD